MSKFKHIVSIRFCAYDMKNNGIIFDKDYLLKRYNLMISHSIKSLENQINKNFTVCLIINDNHSLDDISFLYELKEKSSLSIDIVKLKNLKNYFKSFYNDNEYIISTNIDDDDMCHKECVNIIQHQIKENTIFKMFGFVNCVSIVDNDKTAYLFNKEYLGNTGFHTIMTSIIYKTNIKMTDEFPVMINSVAKKYNGDHPHWKTIIENEYKNWGLEKLDDDYFDYDKNDKEIRLIYIRHPDAASNFLHASNIIVNDINFNDFGYTIDE